MIANIESANCEYSRLEVWIDGIPFDSDKNFGDIENTIIEIVAYIIKKGGLAPKIDMFPKKYRCKNKKLKGA